MHNLIKQKIKDIAEQVKSTKLLEEDILLAERLAPDKRVWIDCDVNVSWPAKSMDEVKSLLRVFAKEGIMLSSVNSKTAPTIWRLEGKNCSICLIPGWSTSEGASCRLVEVERKMVETPVYKLVCDGKEVTEQETT